MGFGKSRSLKSDVKLMRKFNVIFNILSTANWVLLQIFNILNTTALMSVVIIVSKKNKFNYWLLNGGGVINYNYV